MDILKRKFAPLSDNSWEAIDEQAKISLKHFLSARRIVDIAGPKGWNFNAVPTGNMLLEKEPIKYGIRKSLPILEPRVSFSLSKWELDNISRGALDVDLAPLEEAAKKIASFEEQVVYKGLKKAGIQGLFDVSHDNITLAKDTDKWLYSIIDGVYGLKEKAIEGPYALILSPALWKTINSLSDCYPIRKKLDAMLEGPVILSHFIDSGLLVSMRGGDFVLTLGSDFAVGYENNDKETVSLFLTESFTFQIIEPNAVKKIVLAK